MGDAIRAIRLMFATRRRMRRRIRDLERELRMRDRERDSFERQITAYRDFVDSFGWQRRAEGAEAKMYAETIRRPPQ